MEYRGKPTQSNLSADRLAQIFAHVQDAKAAAAQAKAAGARAIGGASARARRARGGAATLGEVPLPLLPIEIWAMVLGIQEPLRPRSAVGR